MMGLYIFFGITFIFLCYLFLIRPRYLRWGAYDDELKRIYPGDNIVSKPHFNATRAISIKTSPDIIWKWIIQIGSKRAGWYSIDWIDNGGKPSSNNILPEFQNIYAGQFIPFTPDQKNGMWVKEYKENEYILWTDKVGRATWLWYLKPVDSNNSRLITRLRTRYTWTSIWIIYYLVYDIGDIIMMIKCMKGIKSRAELTKA